VFYISTHTHKIWIKSNPAPSTGNGATFSVPSLSSTYHKHTYILYIYKSNWIELNPPEMAQRSACPRPAPPHTFAHTKKGEHAILNSNLHTICIKNVCAQTTVSSVCKDNCFICVQRELFHLCAKRTVSSQLCIPFLQKGYTVGLWNKLDAMNQNRVCKDNCFINVCAKTTVSSPNSSVYPLSSPKGIHRGTLKRIGRNESQICVQI